jgi:hypothetical protein
MNSGLIRHGQGTANARHNKDLETLSRIQDLVFRSFVEDSGKGVRIAVTHHDVIPAALGIVDNKYGDLDGRQKSRRPLPPR